ncbi:MAG: MBOAT family O-acyltransferase, partial [Pirellulaceae bacterium]
FKYANFATHNLNLILGWVGAGPVEMSPVRLPIGISFFTFQALSYVLDVYRGHGRATRKPSDVALYIFFFPQLIAGPIVRWEDVAAQMQQRFVTVERFWEGIRRFIYGLAKKVLVANAMATPVDQVFSISPEALSPVLAWVGVICFTLQIYFDFSGYSDMAIGLGKMFGFEFLENFNYPYTAQSIREFWRCWHISLSTWFRDYLYVPMGGNRCSAARNHLNLLVVFFLCGLWHGASWTFVVWGLYHGCFLMLERTKLGDCLGRLSKVLRHAYALLIVIVGWVFFRADTLTQALSFLRAMFGFTGAVLSAHLLELIHALQLLLGQRGGEAAEINQMLDMILTNQVIWIGCAGIVFATPFVFWLHKEVVRYSPKHFRGAFKMALAVGEPILLTALLIISSAWLADGTYNPFIYFKF